MDRDDVQKSPASEGASNNKKGKEITISVSALIKHYNIAIEVGEKTLVLEGSEMDINYMYYLITYNLNKLNLEEKYVFNNNTKMFDEK